MCCDLAIQQVAEKAGLSEHTLRYRERVNLVLSIERVTNGYSRCSEEDRHRIESAERLRLTGTPIGDAQHCPQTYDRGDAASPNGRRDWRRTAGG